MHPRNQDEAADDRPAHVKRFLYATPEWGTKLRRRTATLLSLLDERLGWAAADLLISDPAWTKHMLAGHDDVTMTTAFTTAVVKRLAEEGKIDAEAAAVLANWNDLIEPEEDGDVKECLWGLAMETARWPKERRKKLQEIVAHTPEKVDPMLAFLVDEPDELQHVVIEEGVVCCHRNMVAPFGRWLLERGLTTQEKYEQMVEMLGGGMGS